MDFSGNSASGNGLRAKLLADLAALRTKKQANQPQPTANHVPSSTGEITNAHATITKPNYSFASQQDNLPTRAAPLEPRFFANKFSSSNDATTTNSFDFQYPSCAPLPFEMQFPPTIQKLLDRVGVTPPKKHLNEDDENSVDERPTFVSMQPESVLPNNNNGNAIDGRYYLFPARLHSLFANIDAILPTNQRPVPKGRHPNYYNTQMNISTRLHSQLIDLLILPDLRVDQSAFISSYCSRLNEYIEECSRVLPMYYELDIMKISAACRQIQPILKPYDGNILNWSIFWMTYKEFIANNSVLTNIAKLSLLTANLDANTRLLVNSLSERNINLEEIHQQLEEHFKDEEVLRMEVAAALNKLPSVKSVYAINTWKNMLRSGQLSRRITNDQPEFASIEREWVIILLGKLPPKYTDDYWSIEPRIENEEDGLTLARFESYATQRLGSLNKMVYSGVDLAAINATRIAEEMCPICKKDFHHPERCDLTVDQRRKVLKEHHLCTRCLVVQYFHGHFCGVTCRQCGGDHHMCLCYHYHPTSLPNQELHDPWVRKNTRNQHQVVQKPRLPPPVHPSHDGSSDFE